MSSTATTTPNIGRVSKDSALQTGSLHGINVSYIDQRTLTSTKMTYLLMQEIPRHEGRTFQDDDSYIKIRLEAGYGMEK